MFYGSIVAIVTPMDTQGYLDKDSLANLIAWHIEAGTNAIVVAATTGESPTLTDEERLDIIQFVVNEVRGRIPVIAGSGTNSTAKTIILTREAMTAGVDGCLIVTPYYNKPTQEGLYQHFNAIAKEVPAPIIIYNVPGRTGCDILPETVARLAAIPNVVGIKEATGKVERSKAIVELCGDNLDVFSGDDFPALDIMLAGGKGVISVTANVAPRLMQTMCQAATKGNADEAKAINEKLIPLHKALFIESNPIPVKWALHKMGLIQTGIRLPLTALLEQNHEKIVEALRAAEINFDS
jgi:4-hydroxy-tetrahydrodipicolinate synthase